MIPIRRIAAAAALAALAACAGEPLEQGTVADLASHAKVVTFDVSGMT